MFKSIFYDVKVLPVGIDGAADGEAITSALVDTAGYDGIAFVAYAEKGEELEFTIKARQGTKSDGSDLADLKGTSTKFATAETTDGVAVLDIGRPKKRYVGAVLTVPDATTAKAVAMVALLYNGREFPVDNTGEFHSEPDEGTA